MKLTISLALALLFILPVLSSCVTSHDINLDVSADRFASAAYANSDVTAEIGDKIRIRLVANHSTGFEWSYRISEGNVLKEEDHDFEEPTPGVAGAAGVEVFTFEASAQGSTELRMEYGQPWEGGKKAQWTYTVAVTVE